MSKSGIEAIMTIYFFGRLDLQTLQLDLQSAKTEKP